MKFTVHFSRPRARRYWPLATSHWPLPLWLLALCLLLTNRSAAQWIGAPPPPSELSAAVRVDEADPAARALLQRAAAHAAERQWDDAIETLRQVMEQSGGKLIKLDDRRYIPLREFCQMRLAEMPPEALALYRNRVDPLAKRWYDDAVARRDPQLLRRVVDELFVSSSGDAALLTLGEMSLEAGDFQEARWCWERISPQLRARDGTPLWSNSSRTGLRPDPDGSESHPAAWLAYPDTKLNLADVRARLVLVSIMEGSWKRARVEIDDFARRHPDARGTIGGRAGRYVELLERLLTASQSRPAPAAATDWTTFAGSPERTAHATPEPILHKAWEIPILKDFVFTATTDNGNTNPVLPRLRPADDAQRGLLVFHPLIAGNLVLFNTFDKVFAFDLATGKPAWPVPPRPDNEPGEIYPGTGVDPQALRTEASSLTGALGVPRFTMTVAGQRLFARLGSPITGRPLESGYTTPYSYLVCLDLAAQGRLMWKFPDQVSEDNRWAFEGAPVCDGDSIYIAMRYSDVHPQEHVACFDAKTGVMRWRRLVCSAESLARGSYEEITHNLLTLAHGTLYLNTNLGAIAALAAADGQIRWLTLYPRSGKYDSSSQQWGNGDHLTRDLNPCVYDRGRLFVAPVDYETVLALDAATGQILWDTGAENEGVKTRDIVHLLGVGGDNLIGSGRRLYYFNVDTGQLVYRWPDDNDAVQAFGRGILVDDNVYFPTHTEIRVFHQSQGDPAGARSLLGWEVREPIPLTTRDPPLGDGNLVASHSWLLIATAQKLIAFGPGIPQAKPNEHELTQREPPPR